jgi:hypothetical protein
MAAEKLTPVCRTGRLVLHATGPTKRLMKDSYSLTPRMPHGEDLKKDTLLLCPLDPVKTALISLRRRPYTAYGAVEIQLHSFASELGGCD